MDRSRPSGRGFEADLVKLDTECVEMHDRHPEAKLRILVSVEAEDATRLQRAARASGMKPSEVVAELLHDTAPSGD